jgi:hypothetical protein
MTKSILIVVALLTLVPVAYGGGAPKNMIGVQEAMAATARRGGKTYCYCHTGRATANGQVANVPSQTDSVARPSGSNRATYSGNSMGSDRRGYAGQAAAGAGGIMRQYDARGRSVGSVAR